MKDVTDITPEQLDDICDEILGVFKKHNMDDAEAIGAMFMLISEFYRYRIILDPKKRENMADLIETNFKRMTEEVLGER